MANAKRTGWAVLKFMKLQRLHHLAVSQVVVIVINWIAKHRHKLRWRFIRGKEEFMRSGEIVSRQLGVALQSILKLHGALLKKPEPVPANSNDVKWKWFKVKVNLLLIFIYIVNHSLIETKFVPFI